MSVRTGLGYDIHRLVSDRKLVLGGVAIPYSLGLEGHSDADVLLHAVCDAILGALGQGDIGEHFPNTDERYKDVASTKLLAEVQRKAEAQGYEVAHVDTMVIAQEPTLQDYKAKMKANIAKILQIGDAKVNIKATTPEGLGPLGKKEGIAAYAVVTLEQNTAER